MSKKQEKTNLARKLILEYLLMLHEKAKLREPLSQKEKISISKATNLVAAIYEYGKDQICEPGLGDEGDETEGGKGSNLLEISVSTLGNAIRALSSEGKITLKDDGFHYAFSNEEQLNLYPVLKIAPQITITSLPVNSLAFFRVDKQYAALVTDYINSQVYIDDIHAVTLDDTIVCMDLHLPKTSKSVAKKHSFESRLHRILKCFNLQETKKFDDNLGLSEEEWAAAEEKRAAKKAQAAMEASIESYKYEKEKESEQGGKIINPPKRNIKTKTSVNVVKQVVEE